MTMPNSKYVCLTFPESYRLLVNTLFRNASYAIKARKLTKLNKKHGIIHLIRSGMWMK